MDARKAVTIAASVGLTPLLRVRTSTGRAMAELSLRPTRVA
jgi:hypothetical protein